MNRSGFRQIISDRAALEIVFVVFLIYSSVWSYIALLRYYSFNAGVFDLGLASNLLYSIGHEGIAYLVSSPSHLPLNKMIAVVLAIPYYVFPDPQWLVVFQSVWIGAGIFPLFIIVKKYLNSNFVALLLSVSYLLYYPLAGVNWFDFHFMAIFPTAFLLSIMSYMQGRNKSAVLLGIVAIISDYLVPLTFIFLAVYLIFWKKKTEGKAGIGSYTISVIAVSVIVLLMVNLTFGTGFTTQYMHLSGATYSTSYVASAGEKATYFYAMLLPLVFLSLVGIEFMAVGIPFFALAFVNSYQPYVTTMYFQYPALIAPILFISAAVGLKRIHSAVPRRKMHAIRVIAVTVLLLNIVLFAFFSPIGNIYTGNYYSSHYGKYISGNDYQYTAAKDTTITPYDVYLSQITSSVPLNSNVLIQNNMPQLCAGYNWQLPDFMAKGFQPQYVVVDPYSYFYDHYSAAYHPVNRTMADMAEQYFGSGNYSIVMSLDGVLLMEKNPAAIPLKFVPYTVNVTLSGSSNASLRSLFGTVNATMLAGTLNFTVPGHYRLELSGISNSTLKKGADLIVYDQGNSITITNITTGTTSFGDTFDYFTGPVTVVLFLSGNIQSQGITLNLLENNALQ